MEPTKLNLIATLSEKGSIGFFVREAAQHLSKTFRIIKRLKVIFHDQLVSEVVNLLLRLPGGGSPFTTTTNTRWQVMRLISIGLSSMNEFAVRANIPLPMTTSSQIIYMKNWNWPTDCCPTSSHLQHHAYNKSPIVNDGWNGMEKKRDLTQIFIFSSVQPFQKWREKWIYSFKIQWREKFLLRGTDLQMYRF